MKNILHFDASGRCMPQRGMVYSEHFAFSKQGVKINGYVVTVKGKTLCISTAAETAETAPVAFFQCSTQICAFDVFGLARSNIAPNVVVGCADGQVLRLWAAVLQPLASNLLHVGV